MTIRNTILAVTTLLFPFSAQAGAIPMPGDFYFISRDQHGTFVGSHKLYLEYASGLKHVRYCDRDYFVRSNSVAWTQIEADLGHHVQIEFNFGRGWRPICQRPQDQVALQDLGIDMPAREFLQQQADDDQPVSRLSKISGVFGKSNKESRYKSYHTQ
ncbi:hypothetical protein [Roseibium sp.]|uniref:hypothetical protein n=1 Tax=Roseibium sp. TaxID=1936156 RepID=UPI003B52476E